MRAVPLALAVVSIGLLGLAPAAAADHIPVQEFQKGCGFTEGDYEEGVYDCGGAIPSIQDPSFSPASEVDWLDDGEVVIGVEANGTAKAYPISILNWHEIANDEVDGTPIAVTYCPLCGSSIVFERTVDNRTLDLHVSGYLFRNDLVMIDAQTNSLWPQIAGEAARGDLHGQALTLYPSATMSWSDWLDRHPDTLVLDRPRCDDGSTENRRSCRGDFQRNYESYPYGDYRTNRDIGVSGETRGPVQGLHPKTTVLGVETETGNKAYPLSTISQERVIHDRVGDVPVVVAWTGSDGAAYERAPGQRFELAANDTELVDEDGDRWDVATGQSLQADEPLTPLDSLDLFWFAWTDHQPTTQVYTANGTVNVTREPPQNSAPGPGAVATVVATGLASVLAVTARSRRS